MTTIADTDLQGVATSLLTVGREGTRPAGAVVGTMVDGSPSVAAAGSAVAATAVALRAGADGGRATDVSPRPMTVDTLLDLASVTKVASTTALAMRLVSTGHLDLDAPVVDHLPFFAAHAAEAARGGSRDPRRAEVTVRHLLSHSAGLPPWLPLYCRTTDRDEAITLAATAPLTSDPGTAWAYSDLGMIVLGAVLEQVTGRRQDVAFDELVAQPLGLARTRYGPVAPDSAAASSDSDVVEQQMVATGEPYPTGDEVTDFHGWRTATVVGEVNDGNAAHALAGVAGHAGLFAPLPELLTLGRSLLDTQTVPEAVVREFTTAQPVGPGQGLGFRLMTGSFAGQRIPMAVHAGFTGTWLGTALDRDLVVAVAATRLHTTTGTPASPLNARTDLVTTTEIATTALDGIGVATLASRPTTTGAP